MFIYQPSQIYGGHLEFDLIADFHANLFRISGRNFGFRMAIFIFRCPSLKFLIQPYLSQFVSKFIFKIIVYLWQPFWIFGSNLEFFVAQPQRFTPMQNLNLSFTVDQSCNNSTDCYENGKRCDGWVDVTCLCKQGQCKKSGEKTMEKTHQHILLLFQLGVVYMVFGAWCLVNLARRMTVRMKADVYGVQLAVGYAYRKTQKVHLDWFKITKLPRQLSVLRIELCTEYGDLCSTN